MRATLSATPLFVSVNSACVSAWSPIHATMLAVGVEGGVGVGASPQAASAMPMMAKANAMRMAVMAYSLWGFASVPGHYSRINGDSHPTVTPKLDSRFAAIHKDNVLGMPCD